jgi:hypothetical protein
LNGVCNLVSAIPFVTLSKHLNLSDMFPRLETGDSNQLIIFLLFTSGIFEKKSQLLDRYIYCNIYLIATEGEDLNERISFPVERMEQ